MDIKKVAWIAVGLIALVIFVLSSSIVADQAEKWVAANPKDPEAPKVLYKAARWCDLMGDNDRAVASYWRLYEQYPGESKLVVEGLYYCAVIKSEGQNILVLRQQANPYLRVILDQYGSEPEWHAKAQKLFDEVNYVH